MPNWSATNYVVTGDKNELQKFADIVNSLPSKKVVHENGFGKLWLGNLVALLGGSWDKGHFRGVIDTDPDLCACFVGPSESEEFHPLVVEDNDTVGAILRFSTMTAWSRSDDLEELLKANFPSMGINYKTTDEFGNFYLIHDPDGVIEQGRYYLYIPDEVEISTNDADEIIRLVQQTLEISDRTITFKEIPKLLKNANLDYYEFEIWKEE